jgi:hypothetical protein
MFWDNMQRRVVISYRRFGTIHRSYVRGSTSWISRAMKMGPMGCHETSVRNCHCTLRIIPEERRSHLHRCGRLKSRIGSLCKHTSSALLILNPFHTLSQIVLLTVLPTLTPDPANRKLQSSRPQLCITRSRNTKGRRTFCCNQLTVIRSDFFCIFSLLFMFTSISLLATCYGLEGPRNEPR